MLEFQQFNAMWDAKMGEYEQRATELLEAMRARHTLDARELRRRSSENDGATRRWAAARRNMSGTRALGARLTKSARLADVLMAVEMTPPRG
eukprot:6182906-Pleurochrysis_carterae.AAC.1